MREGAQSAVGRETKGKSARQLSTLFRLYLSPDWHSASPRWGFQLRCDPNRNDHRWGSIAFTGSDGIVVCHEKLGGMEEKLQGRSQVKW